MTTKDKCIKALDCLADDDKMDELAQKFSIDDDYTSHINYEIARKWCYDQLKQCIDEHFDNPPLEFEELEERETYYHIYYGWISIRSISDCECILITTLNSDGYKQIEFEENCFYRKQVEE